MEKYPDKIAHKAALEDLLSLPTEASVKLFSEIDGDIMFLGIGGKIGPTLARMAKRACDQAGVKKTIYGVSLFESEKQRKQIEELGIETIHGDLLDTDFIKGLPIAKNIFFLAGMKFGSEENISLTWAVNSYMPALIADEKRSPRETGPKRRTRRFQRGRLTARLRQCLRRKDRRNKQRFRTD